MDGRPNRRNKAPFSRQISVDGRPNRRNKAALSKLPKDVFLLFFSGLGHNPNN